jgi:hypothetical protein
MQPKKSHLSRIEQAMMSAFRVQPDWYEEYWLRSKKSSRKLPRKLPLDVADHANYGRLARRSWSELMTVYGMPTAFEECPSLRAKRKTYARTEFFSV